MKIKEICIALAKLTIILLLLAYGIFKSVITVGWFMLFYFGTEKTTYNYFTIFDIVRMSLPLVAIVLAILLIFDKEVISFIKRIKCR